MAITYEYLHQEYIINKRSQSEIAKDCGCTAKNINYYVRKYKLYKGTKIKHLLNDKAIDSTNPIFCYFAGLTATDGHIDYKNNRVTIRVKNEGSKEVLTHLLEYFGSELEVACYETGYEIRLTSKKLLNELALLNVLGTHKTYTLDFPKHFHNTACARMYLRGVLDGDGNIHLRISPYTSRVTGGQFRIVTASTLFIQGLITYTNLVLNLNNKISNAKVRGINYPKLEMKVKDSMLFYDYIYIGYDKFRFSDKYSKYLQLKGEEIV